MALDSHIFTIVEPKIKLDSMKVPNLGERESGDKSSSFQGGITPYIKINNYTFQPDAVDAFVLDLNGKYPEIRARIADSENVFTVDQFPRDGDVLSLRIELDKSGTYKDIRMDFTILEFKGAPASSFEKKSGSSMFSIRAIAKIPGMYTDECKSYGLNTSLEHIKLVASDLKLGVSTNISSVNDEMRRFCAYQTKIDLIENTVLHSYISDDAFQTFSIDPYYYISFVDLQKVFNAPNDIELGDFITGEMFNERGIDSDAGAGTIKGQLILTNHHNMKGTNTEILRYNLVNNSTKVALENGYRRKMQYFDVNQSELLEFDVESLVSDNVSDREEALKGRRNSETDEYDTHIKQKYVGVQNENTHLNYNYAAINNIQNLVELDKMYLEVELSTVNPAIYKYMKLPVSIYNYGHENTQVSKDISKEAKESDFELKSESDNFGKQDNKDEDRELDKFTLDEFLTAHYVVMGIKYKYDPKLGYTQVLKLARREWPARLSNV
jgi:hypothetical protein